MALLLGQWDPSFLTKLLGFVLFVSARVMVIVWARGCLYLYGCVNACAHVCVCVYACASRAYCTLFGHRIIEDEFDGHWLNNQTKDTLDTSAHQEMKPVSLVAVTLGVCDGLTIARCMALFLCTLTDSLCLVCAHVTG